MLRESQSPNSFFLSIYELNYYYIAYTSKNVKISWRSSIIRIEFHNFTETGTVRL